MSSCQGTGGSPGSSPVEQRLLLPLLDAASSLGHTPLPRDVPGSSRIVRHFRNWNNAVAAAGLPSTNDPEQHRLRAQYRRMRKAQERCTADTAAPAENDGQDNRGLPDVGYRKGQQ